MIFKLENVWYLYNYFLKNFKQPFFSFFFLDKNNIKRKKKDRVKNTIEMYHKVDVQLSFLNNQILLILSFSHY